MEKGHLTLSDALFLLDAFITPNVNVSRNLANSETAGSIHPQDLPGIHISEARFAWSDVHSPA
jgi:hypothetical protein